MNVRSLWIRRTSKIFSRPRPASVFQSRRVTVVVALVVLLAERAAVPAVFDVAEQLDAELVRIQPRRRAGHRAAVVIAVVDHVAGGQALPGHDRASASSWPSLRS